MINAFLTEALLSVKAAVWRIEGLRHSRPIDGAVYGTSERHPAHHTHIAYYLESGVFLQTWNLRSGFTDNYVLSANLDN